jgi:hypothetical protein
VSWAGNCQRNALLARLALHPRDALDPATLRHCQSLLERLVQSRHAQTKAAFAAFLRARRQLRSSPQMTG